jgi:Tfp pilus assembly protein PilV
MRFFSSKKQGISVVEIVIAAGIIGVTVTAITGVIQFYLKIVYQNTRETQAVMLLDETSEALQYLRDASYATNFKNVTENKTYTVFWNGTGYELGTSAITLPYGMTRTITFDSVQRDSSDQITQNGTIDPDTKKARILIEWPHMGEPKNISAEVLIHNTYEN